MSTEEIADRNRDEMIRELAALKAERTELREALQKLAYDVLNAGYSTQVHDAYAQARAILKRTAEKD